MLYNFLDASLEIVLKYKIEIKTLMRIFDITDANIE